MNSKEATPQDPSDKTSAGNTIPQVTLKAMEQIVTLQMKEVGERLSEQGLTVELTDAARQWLAKQGYDPQFGARPLRRAIQKHVESPLSVRLLRGEFHTGDCVIVDTDHDELTFKRKESADELASVPQAESVPLENQKPALLPDANPLGQDAARA